MIKTYSRKIKNLSKTEYTILRKIAYHSARLYNYALYKNNEQYAQTKTYSNFYENCISVKECINYQVMPSAIAQQTLKILDRNYKSFFALKQKSKHDYRFQNVSTPNFLKKESLFVIVVSKNGFQIKDKYIQISCGNTLSKEHGIKNIKFYLPDFVMKEKIKEIRIIPIHNGKFFDLNVIYEITNVELKSKESQNVLGIDIGVNNFATCYDSKNCRSFIISGKGMKSINHYYNKRKAKYQGIAKKVNGKYNTKFLDVLTDKRGRQIKDFINKTVKYLVDYCINNDLDTIIIGHNKGWKNESDMCKQSNQNFVQIPFGKLISGLENKCQEFGLLFREVSEHHTSKCSFIDFEEPKHHDEYLGKRTKRGLFKTKNGYYLNADSNASANISTKAIVIPVRDERVLAALIQPSKIRFDYIEQTFR